MAALPEAALHREVEDPAVAAVVVAAAGLPVAGSVPADSAAEVVAAALAACSGPPAPAGNTR